MTNWSTPAGERWRWAGLVIAVALALLVGGAVLQSRLTSWGLMYDRRTQVASQFLTMLTVGLALFLGVFAALHCNALIDARAHHSRRRGLLANLATELAFLPATPERPATGTGYRDPLRLTILPQILASDLLHPRIDATLVAALLHLHRAVGRYNDLVLTNALILAEGQRRDMDTLAAQYWRAAQSAAAEVRALLDDRGIRPPSSATPIPAGIAP